jgi:hypothetical protein
VLISPSSSMLTMEADSYVDVPKDLLKEIERLEQLFSIDTAKLKQITDHFVNELEKGRRAPHLVSGPAELTFTGLSVGGGSIVSLGVPGG